MPDSKEKFIIFVRTGGRTSIHAITEEVGIGSSIQVFLGNQFHKSSREKSIEKKSSNSPCSSKHIEDALMTTETERSHPSRLHRPDDTIEITEIERSHPSRLHHPNDTIELTKKRQVPMEKLSAETAQISSYTRYP
ncbi:unnamed protein product [Pocillopora meandrina]|uniref:Uncharacterized protein n=1 Tax=Pocillopora meandrina TaxID=46732 RepID=A0AAU9WZM1_9CNID|nr:unnamed protein product [Pocillopora meandrina]